MKCITCPKETHTIQTYPTSGHVLTMLSLSQHLEPGALGPIFIQWDIQTQQFP